ncbi:SDR family NAD(P)-dependent oxidoreductase [Vitreoscilla stercoraria]|uniref:SDR family NAD(P)-dependent oxidoreductase n=1 Tax=Vitreoscilla stercoraria TaxID=61 RepID=A0ABY4E832_VITST|nr:SDR family NAD(P)-dependent oxidoreductase [Vitreoscilla stercoraria]UOO91429.1 SDR family NAD(P)-dependent oxidoreductase [Vitreoscilla stercoraria]
MGQETQTLYNQKVVITGAARGMGELYARKAVAQGAKYVVLWDVDAQGAHALAADLMTQGAKVLVVSENLAQLDSIRAGAQQVKAFLDVPDVLINNAGIVRGSLFWEHDSEKDIELTMRINTLAPMWLTREFLPEMLQDTSRRKRILNVASAAGTLANPNMSVYAASKWAMIGWSDSLRLECQKMGHTHVSVTTFCPSYVSTGMFDGAKGPLLTPILNPTQAVERAWRGMLQGNAMVYTPWTVKLAMACRGVLPLCVWDWVAEKVFGVYASMDEFNGKPTV